jgi:hypothetical protein
MKSQMKTKAGAYAGICKESVLRKLRRTDWSKFAMAIGATIIFWTGMRELMPEQFHHQVEVILAAANAAILFLLKGEKGLPA